VSVRLSRRYASRAEQSQLLGALGGAVLRAQDAQASLHGQAGVPNFWQSSARHHMGEYKACSFPIWVGLNLFL